MRRLLLWRDVQEMQVVLRGSSGLAFDHHCAGLSEVQSTLVTLSLQLVHIKENEMRTAIVTQWRATLVTLSFSLPPDIMFFSVELVQAEQSKLPG